MPVTQYDVGVRLHDMGLITNGGGYTFQDGITAAAGGGQAAAVPLTKALNRITTVATAADSVALPPAVGGQDVSISNTTTTSATVFGALGHTDTINGTAGATGVALAGGKTGRYTSFVGAWQLQLSA